VTHNVDYNQGLTLTFLLTSYPSNGFSKLKATQHFHFSMATIFDIDTVGKNYYLIIRLTLRPDSQIHYTVICFLSQL